MFQLSSPVIVQWETTPLCNHRCIHCYNYWREKDGPILKYAIPKNIDAIYSRTINEILKNKVLHVVVTGGEPLLVFNQIYPYLKILKKHHVFIHLNSNLTLLTPSIAQKIKVLNIPILVSVPSYDPKTTALITNSPHAFSMIEKGIRLARRYNIELLANMVITKINLDQIYQTAKYIKELGINTFGASKACTPINCDDFSAYTLTLEETRSIFNQLIKIEKKLSLKVASFIGSPTCMFTGGNLTDFAKARICHAGQTTCTIGSNGEIRSCPHLDKVYGNVMDDDLKKSWAKMVEWRDGSLTPEQCSHCKLRDSCAGGCKVEALKRFGKLSLPDPYADFTNHLEKFSHEDKINLPTHITGDFIVNPKLIFRKENSGGILYGRKLVQIDDPLFFFLKEKNGQKVIVDDFINALGWSKEAAKKFYSCLINDDILIKSVNKTS